MYIDVCVSVFVEVRSQTQGLFLGYHHHVSFGGSGASPVGQGSWLQVPGIHSPLLPQHWDYESVSMPGFFCPLWVLGIKLRSSCVCRKHFTKCLRQGLL